MKSCPRILPVGHRLGSNRQHSSVRTHSITYTISVYSINNSICSRDEPIH